MKRHAIILSALIVPGLAFAGDKAGEQAKTGQQETEAWGEKQQAGEEYGQQEKAKEYGESAQHAQMGQMGAQQTEQIRGEVAKVDLAKGELEIKKSEGEEQVTLHGSPDQLRQYQEGQQVNVDVRKFGENQWLTSKAAAGEAAGGKTIQARVANVDEDKGEIELDTDPGRLKANPQDLENVQPGQQVSVTFEEVEGENWVSSIKQDQAGQQGIEGQMQEGQEQQREIEREMEGMDEPDPMME